MTKVKKRSSKCSQRQSLEINTNKHKDLDFALTNYGEEDEIYPLTTIETAEAQCNQELKVYYKKNA
jgi:hypothetical protein